MRTFDYALQSVLLRWVCKNLNKLTLIYNKLSSLYNGSSFNIYDTQEKGGSAKKKIGNRFYAKGVVQNSKASRPRKIERKNCARAQERKRNEKERGKENTAGSEERF